MTPEQEQEIRSKAIAFVAALNAAGCYVNIDHRQHEFTMMGEGWPSFRHSIRIDIVRTKRIEVG